MNRTAVAYIQPSEQETATQSLPAGVELIATTHEGVGAALERIASGQAQTLFVARLRDAAGSLPALVGLLDWLSAADATLLAADVGLDTGTAAGARVVALLREINGWGREGGQARRGRPGLGADSPELASRIAELRARGLTLNAIAAQLNEDGIPTPRGGAQWRPSSVQAALGYRRPRPPVPGAPPPPGKHRPGAGKQGPGHRPPKPAGRKPPKPARHKPRKP